MIRLENVSKAFHLEGKHKIVLHQANATVPSRTSVALIGRNGAGKSTLLQMISGNVPVDSGRIVSDGLISWPVGFAGSFHGDLSGAQNTRFIARIYGVDTEALVRFAEDFAEIGDHFHLPFRTFSSGMRSRLAFGISMGIKFDTYLVDEVTAVGDAAFKAKSEAMFRARMEQSGGVVVSHSMGQLRKLCSAGMVLEAGHLDYYEDIRQAVEHYEALVKGELPPWLRGTGRPHPRR